VGADTRCMVEGTSSLSAFLRMALPTDSYNNLFLDINVAGTASNVEPIDILENKYNQWKNSHTSYCDSVSSNEIFQKKNVEIHPNPTYDLITISNVEGSNKIELFSFNGEFLENINGNTVSLRNYPKGIYIIKITFEDRVEEMKVVKY
ncbi:MAG: T9SS type A sorting domain-containing protein, partial [Flavobacteriales bacterium]